MKGLLSLKEAGLNYASERTCNACGMKLMEEVMCQEEVCLNREKSVMVVRK